MIYYSGIGARKTGVKILIFMTQLAKYFAEQDYVLRSGGANGADSAFEEGCDLSQGKKEIYLPWKGFNNNLSSLYDLSNKKEAMALAEAHHPQWHVLSGPIRNLHTRNTYQILGMDLKTPSKFVVCYTDGMGGTMQSIRLAKTYNIPIFNLKLDKEALNVDPYIYGEYIEQKVGLR